MKKIIALVLALVMVAACLTACGGAKGATLKDVQKAGKLTIATSPDFPPFESLEGNEVVGIEVDIMELICKELGVEAEFVQMDFDSVLIGIQAAKYDWINLQICSPYRDMNRQVYLFQRKINAYMKQGMSYMDAYALTAQAVTVPGASEHQIGLALDIVCDTYSYLNEGFGDTEAGKWLAEHSCEYGFILRYPKGKEYITGIEYEPWHFRYVGREAAMIITSEELTLEEFVDSLDEWR